MSELLFAYGTLQPGLVPVAMERVCRRLRVVGPATMAGRLYDLGHYPGAIVGGEGLIYGQIVEVDCEQTWQALDRYEGCPPEGEGEGLFRRVRAVATLADGEALECWVYVYARDLGAARPIDGGCWQRRGDSI